MRNHKLSGVVAALRVFKGFMVEINLVFDSRAPTYYCLLVAMILKSSLFVLALRLTVNMIEP